MTSKWRWPAEPWMMYSRVSVCVDRDDGAGAPDDPERAVPEAEGEGIDDVDGGGPRVHEGRDPLRFEPGQEQQQGDAVGQLRLALAAARETRVRVRRLERAVEPVAGSVRIVVEPPARRDRG